MTDERAFIQALASTPDGAFASSAYADWLENNGAAELSGEDHHRTRVVTSAAPRIDPLGAALIFNRW